MNRTYIKPETKVYEIETQPLMALSGGETMRVSNEVVNTQMGKESDFDFDLWADEED